MISFQLSPNRSLISGALIIVCLEARLVLIFCCAPNTDRFNVFQHFSEIKRNRTFAAQISRPCYLLLLCMKRFRNLNLLLRMKKRKLEYVVSSNYLFKIHDGFFSISKPCVFCLFFCFNILFSFCYLGFC